MTIYNSELHTKDLERAEKDLAEAEEEANRFREMYDERTGDTLDLSEKLRNANERIIALMEGRVDLIMA